MPVYSITPEDRVFPPEKPDQKIMLMNQGSLPIQYEVAPSFNDASPWIGPARSAVLPAGVQFLARAPTAVGVTYGKLMVARLPVGI